METHLPWSRSDTGRLRTIDFPMTGAAGPQGARRRGTAALATALAVAVSLATPERAAACTLTTTGPASVGAGALFTLTLSAVNTGDGLPTSWIISWGDGAIQTLAGNPASVTHIYTPALTPSNFTYNVLASAVCNGKTYLRPTSVFWEAAVRSGE